MHIGKAEQYSLTVTFQRQWRPKTLEMRFIGLRKFHLTGVEPDYLPEIFEAHLAFIDNLLPGEPQKVIVWSDNCEFDAQNVAYTVTEPGGSYIIANRAVWRTIDN